MCVLVIVTMRSLLEVELADFASIRWSCVAFSFPQNFVKVKSWLLHELFQ